MFLENFVPGKLDSMSLGYDVISEINPKIIYCSLTGFGARGPDKELPGYDLIASAIGGGLHVTGCKVWYIYLSFGCVAYLLILVSLITSSS